jgi:DeoR/GlpR family transcriptional regulator of sugar metabolism
MTHGSKAIEELQNLNNINLYSSGGLMLRGTYSLSGEFVRLFFGSFFTDAAFISCKGISMNHGLSWAYDEEAALRRIMLQNTKKRILLCDSDKFDRTYTSKLFGFELIDMVITNHEPSADWLDFFINHGIRVLY